MSLKRSKDGWEVVSFWGVQNQFAESFQWLQLVLKEDVSWNNLSCNLLSSPSNSLLSLLNSSELNFLQMILYPDRTWAAKVKFADRALCHPSTHTPSKSEPSRSWDSAKYITSFTRFPRKHWLHPYGKWMDEVKQLSGMRMNLPTVNEHQLFFTKLLFRAGIRRCLPNPIKKMSLSAENWNLIQGGGQNLAQISIGSLYMTKSKKLWIPFIMLSLECSWIGFISK